MKYLFTFYTLFFITLFFGQNNKSEEPVVFIDLNLVPSNTIEYFDPNEIESINVVKKDTTVNGVLYRGQINITSKNPKKYDFISLEQIKSEFTKIKSNDVVYIVNGTFIKDNIETFKLDRNYILKVEVTNSEEFYNLKESNTKFDIINILGKTKENLENKNTILLRGHEAIGVK
jgi:galactitol-specific phosphotransferase system IIB component